MGGHSLHAGHDPAQLRAADHGQHAEPAVGAHGDHAARFRDRFWVSLVLAVPVVAFSPMFADLIGYTVPAFPGARWLSPVLGTVLFLYGGQPFLTGAASEVRSRQPGMMLLVALAISVAFLASCATTLRLGGFALDFWWELALLIVIMLLGHWLEMRALGAVSSTLDALAALLPDTANRVTDAGVVEVPLARLCPGDLVLVRPGERVPADGTVLDGVAEVDESMITGESKPVAKAKGATVVAGHGRDRQRAAGAGQRGRGRHRARRDPAAGRRGAGVLVAGPGTGRPGRGFPLRLRAGHRGDHVRGVDRARPGRRRGDPQRDRAGDRVSARPRARHPARNRDRHRTGRERGCPGEEPSGPGADAPRRRGALRQDRHPHPGEPEVSGVATVPGVTEEDLLALASAVEADSEHPLAR